MMPLIEGVGDEVVQFAAVVVVVTVAAAAWWSTSARSHRYRTVFVMPPRNRPAVTVSFRRSHSGGNTSTSIADSNTTTDNNESAGSESVSPRMIAVQEMDSIVDADMAMMDDDRLHFYRRLDNAGMVVDNGPESGSEQSETAEEPEPASTDQMREMDSIVSAMEADVTAARDIFNRPSESPEKESELPDRETSSSNVNIEKNVIRGSSKRSSISEGTETVTSQTVSADGDQPNKIHIKLKYLNDTLKEVEGSLNERLKDFKWRNFSNELTSSLRVRLIFNGRVLSDDAATLRACGLHDRAVVHCLVHPQQRSHQHQRIVSEEPALNATTHEIVTEAPQQERAWDLENVLMTLVSVALTVVWFFRCEYSNMFTASASVALFGLTVFYSVAIFGLYLSDTFNFTQRTPQPVPVPNN